MSLFLIRRVWARDVTDEYEPLDRWRGERVLQESTDFNMRVVLVVTIDGRRSRRGHGTLRPDRVSAHVAFADARLTVPDVHFPKGFTLHDVEDAMASGDFRDFVSRVVRQAYDGRYASCVSRVTPKGLEPHFSLLAPPWSDYVLSLPVGTYVQVSRCFGELRVSELERVGHGYVVRTSPEITASVRAEEHYWAPPRAADEERFA